MHANSASSDAAIDVVVVDASAVVDLLVGPADRRASVTASLGRGAPLHAPDLLTSEVVSALSGIARGGDLAWTDARRALDAYAGLPVRRHATHPFRNRILDLSRSLPTAYDATYVALAEALGATLLTTDQKLARAATTIVVDVPA